MPDVGLPFDPAVALAILAATGLYVRAVVTLRRRGQEISPWQQLAWHSGVGLTALGFLSPVDSLSDELLSAHMAQHLLIADLAAPLLLVGLRTPVLQFYLPRPILVPLARRKGLRRAFRALRRPLVALPLYVLVLYGWHLPFMFEGAVNGGAMHALQHQSFVLVSMLVWWPALEPKRRRLRGELWKIGHIIGARLAGMFLAMAFIAMRSPVYEGAYGSGKRRGLDAVADQQVAGGLMLSLDLILMLSALAFFFWRAGQDHDRAERVPVVAP
jgi:putative copper resistance protein D